MASPKIDYAEEKKKYDAYEESMELSFKKCDHSKVKFGGDELRCTCGNAWRGSRLAELYKLFTQNGTK